MDGDGDSHAKDVGNADWAGERSEAAVSDSSGTRKVEWANNGSQMYLALPMSTESFSAWIMPGKLGGIEQSNAASAARLNPW